MLKKVLMALVLMSSISAFAKTEKVEIDTQGSKLVYHGKKVASGHTGELKLQSGFLTFEKDVLKGGEFVIDMTSITNADIESPEWKQKFIDHLKNDDFFSVDKFKTSKIVLKDAKKVKGNVYKITADLTIKGVTAPVTFDATVTKADASAKVVFDRTKYGVQYNSGKFFQSLGDKLILDDVELDVTLKAKK